MQLLIMNFIEKKEINWGEIYGKSVNRANPTGRFRHR